MSSGPQACYDEMMEEHRAKNRKVFEDKPINVVVETIESVIEGLQRLSNCPELCLTKANWIRLDHCLSSVKSLIGK